MKIAEWYDFFFFGLTMLYRRKRATLFFSIKIANFSFLGKNKFSTELIRKNYRTHTETNFRINIFLILIQSSLVTQ